VVWVNGYKKWGQMTLEHGGKRGRDGLEVGVEAEAGRVDPDADVPDGSRRPSGGWTVAVIAWRQLKEAMEYWGCSQLRNCLACILRAKEIIQPDGGRITGF
jgi:hypothetical protein